MYEDEQLSLANACARACGCPVAKMNQCLTLTCFCLFTPPPNPPPPLPAAAGAKTNQCLTLIRFCLCPPLPTPLPPPLPAAAPEQKRTSVWQGIVSGRVGKSRYRGQVHAASRSERD